MELIVKRNTELTREEVEELFKIYFENITPILDVYKSRAKIYDTNEHREEWITGVLTDNTLRCFKFVENNKLIGFILIEFLENENFIFDFDIIDEYKSDGITFNKMIELAFPYCQEGKEFTGIIWRENENALMKFKSIGALLINKKYRLSYDKVKEMIEKNKSN